MEALVLTVDDVAELVQLGPEAVRRAVRRGELRASKLGGRIRIRRDDVNAWIEAQTLATPAMPAPAAAPRPSRPGGRPAGGSQVLALMERHAND